MAGPITELLDENTLVIPSLEKEQLPRPFRVAFWDMTREGKEGRRTEVAIDIDIAVNPE